MKRIVIDASSLLASLLPAEEYQAHADALIQLHANDELRLCAPPLLASEIQNALYLAVRGKAGRPPRLSLEGAKERWRLFRDLQIVLTEPDGERVLELANQYRMRSAYDAVYLALAEQLKFELVTSDKAFLTLLKDQVWVKPLWTFTAEV